VHERGLGIGHRAGFRATRRCGGSRRGSSAIAGRRASAWRPVTVIGGAAPFSAERTAECSTSAPSVSPSAPAAPTARCGSRPPPRALRAPRPVDPVLLQFHIWAMTENYAVRHAEVSYMLDLAPGQSIDIEHVVSEMTNLVLAGVEIHRMQE
jgi:hypothetical protein